jgi:hypothetical protein
MKQLISILSILVSFLIFAGTLRSETTSVALNSPVNISHAMDFAVRSNSLNYLYDQEPVTNDTIDTKANEFKAGKFRSPTKALVIALVPGSVVHGAGYFYAEKPKIGLFLFSIEVIGAGLLYAGALSGFAEEAQEGTGKDRPGLTWIGLALFGGSWLADIIGAPEAVKKHNEGIVKK